METPLVKHFMYAEQELRSWQMEPITSRLDQHVLSQLTDWTYLQLQNAEYYEFANELGQMGLLSVPVNMRVEGTKPWKLYVCDCCNKQDDKTKRCGQLCTCGFECTCGSTEFYNLRPLRGADMHVVAPTSWMNRWRAVQVLCGLPDISEMPYAVFNTLELAVNRSLNSPFWNAPIR